MCRAEQYKIMNYMKNISNYTLVSGVALGVDISVMSMHYSFYPSSIIFSTALGYLMGAAVSYFLLIKFVFKYRKYTKNKILESSLFLFTGLTGLTITELVMWCGVDVFQIDVLASNFVL